MKPVTTIVAILLSAISIAGRNRCKWFDHSCLAKHFWLYCPRCTGIYAVAGE
jgi:hypothetical protein